MQVTPYFIYLLGIFKIFKKLIHEGYNPDIIHAHVFSAGVSAVILGKLYKISVIIIEHYTNIAIYSLKLIEKIKARFAMNRVKFILPVSRDLKHVIQDHYHIKSRFIVVPNAVNTKIYYLLNFYSNKRKYGKKMLAVSGLIPRKGIVIY